jgi:hypothetical protein
MRFFAEPVLSETKRFLASLGMTVSEGLRMTSEGLRMTSEGLVMTITVKLFTKQHINELPFWIDGAGCLLLVGVCGYWFFSGQP